jgi:hypothetical protein
LNRYRLIVQQPQSPPKATSSLLIAATDAGEEAAPAERLRLEFETVPNSSKEEAPATGRCKRHQEPAFIC